MIVRGDLSPGQQIAQAVHAAFDFTSKHPELTLTWNRDSNYLVVCQVPDEAALVALTDRAKHAGLRCHLVAEPDYDGEVTALVIEPGERTSKLCASLPLAGKELAMR